MEYEDINLFDVSPQADIKISINKKPSPKTRQYTRVRKSMQNDVEKYKIDQNATKYDALRESIYSRLNDQEKHYDAQFLKLKKSQNSVIKLNSLEFKTRKATHPDIRYKTYHDKGKFKEVKNKLFKLNKKIKNSKMANSFQPFEYYNGIEKVNQLF